MKIVINRSFGGPSLSKKALGMLGDGFDIHYKERRNDPALVFVVETLGEAANGDSHSALKVVKIPDDVKWYIRSDDGAETIHEVHRMWC